MGEFSLMLVLHFAFVLGMPLTLLPGYGAWENSEHPLPFMFVS